MRTLEDAAAALAEGSATGRGLLGACLERARDPSGEGARAFVRLDAEAAEREASFHDAARAAGRAASPYAGVPVSIKDLFDVAGSPTRAASKVLEDAPPAKWDAPAVARLRALGFVFVGRTNMTEFAYSGLGMNAHFGTPLNPWDRGVGRIPGGSTSGGVVSVTDGMALAALGTDTGGSCRIPAALSGAAGFKPTSGRIPREGMVPLSPSLDSVGSIARSIRCCALIDSAIAGCAPERPDPPPARMLRLGLLQTLVLEDMDEHVSAAYRRAVSGLSRAGAQLSEVEIPGLAEYPHVNRKGGIVSAEAYAHHRAYLEDRSGRYDPWILGRFEAGKSQSAADYQDLLAARRDLTEAARRASGGFDALVMPTVPVAAPALADMQDPAASGKANRLLLRNTSVWNFIDRPAASVPCHEPGEPPAGLMLVGHAGDDRRLLAVAAAAEDALARAGMGGGRPRPPDTI